MGIFIQVLMSLLLLALHLPVILLWVDSHVVPIPGSGAALIIGPITLPVALLITAIGAVSSRRFRRNVFVWLITAAGIAAFTWMQMQVAKGF